MSGHAVTFYGESFDKEDQVMDILSPSTEPLLPTAINDDAIDPSIEPLPPTVDDDDNDDDDGMQGKLSLICDM